MKKFLFGLISALALGFLVMFFTGFPLGWYVCAQKDAHTLTSTDIILLSALSAMMVAIGMAVGARLGYKWATKANHHGLS